MAYYRKAPARSRSRTSYRGNGWGSASGGGNRSRSGGKRRAPARRANARSGAARSARRAPVGRDIRLVIRHEYPNQAPVHDATPMVPASEAVGKRKAKF